MAQSRKQREVYAGGRAWPITPKTHNHGCVPYHQILRSPYRFHIHPTQRHQVGAKCSNIGACGGHFTSKAKWEDKWYVSLWAKSIFIKRLIFKNYKFLVSFVKILTKALSGKMSKWGLLKYVILSPEGDLYYHYISLFLARVYFIFHCVHCWGRTCIIHTSAVACGGQRRASGSPKAGVLGYCELPAVGTGNWTLVLCKRSVWA